MTEETQAREVPELAALPPEQRAEAWQALHAPSWGRHHPVNIRLSLPLPGRRLYLTIVAGAERRHPDRLRRERQFHPLLTPGNLAFLLLSLAIAGGLAYFIVRGMELLARL